MARSVTAESLEAGHRKADRRDLRELRFRISGKGEGHAGVSIHSMCSTRMLPNRPLHLGARPVNSSALRLPTLGKLLPQGASGIPRKVLSPADLRAAFALHLPVLGKRPRPARATRASNSIRFRTGGRRGMGINMTMSDERDAPLN